MTPAVFLRKTRTLLRLIRNYLRDLLSSAGRQGSADDYQSRVARELSNYADCSNVHELPLIFHYWSHKYLAPMFTRLGVNDPEQFYFVYAQKFHERFPAQDIRIASVGCGNCDLEARLARRLLDAGIRSFRIVCLDINPAMLTRGKQYAAELGVGDHIETEC